MFTLAPLPSTQTRVSTATALLVLCAVIAAGLRIPGLFTDFWGDEIWSWSIAGQLHSVSDILLSGPAHIDNNHPLNTLWLYVLGQNQPVWLYRLPALIAGAGSVVLAVLIMRRYGKAEATIAAVLFGLSYPLIFYSSEARGYSFAVFFSLLSYEFLRRSLSTTESVSRGVELLFGCTCVLGFLSHLTFLHIYLASLVWSMIRVRKLEPTTRLRALRLARLHAIPLIASLLLFHFWVKDMMVGGAPPTSPQAVIVQTLSLTAGGPERGLGAGICATAVACLFVSGLIYLARNGATEWIFFLVAASVAPAMACARDLCFSERPQPLMLRYFLVCTAMLLLSVCPLLATLWARGRRWQIILVSALSMFTVANAKHLGEFVRCGRGKYSQGLSAIAYGSVGSTILVSSDNPLRTAVLMEFYGPRVAPDKKFATDDLPHDWLVLNRAGQVARQTLVYGGWPYRLKYDYPCDGLSGWDWEVYHVTGNGLKSQKTPILLGEKSCR